MYEIVLNMDFVTCNPYIKAERENKYQGAKIMKRQVGMVATLCALQKIEPLPDETYDIEYTWFKPDNRIDHGNIAFCDKFVMDGLIKAKVIKNDGPKVINRISHDFEIDRTREYISCIIKFIKKEEE